MKTVELWINYGIMALTNKITFDLTKSFGDQRENNLEMHYIPFVFVVLYSFSLPGSSRILAS